MTISLWVSDKYREEIKMSPRKRRQFTSNRKLQPSRLLEPLASPVANHGSLSVS